MELAAIALALLVIQALFLAWERLAPARAFPSRPLWQLRGLIAFAITNAIGLALPLAYAEHLAPLALFDLSSLGTAGGFAVGLAALEVGIYAWHRALHASSFLFRVLHQMHHSAERLDVASAWLFHPLDTAMFGLVQTLALTIAGVSADAAVLVGIVAFALGVLQHANVATPRWLGWFVQRPEAHAVHHERGVHAFNYADLPILDRLFGTFRNPASWHGRSGYWDGASDQVPAMLVGVDVTEERAARAMSSPIN